MVQVKVEKLHTLAGHKDCVYSLEKSNEKNIFYSASGDGMVVSWNLKNPEIGRVLAKVPNSVYALRFIEDKNQLLIGQNFEGIHLIDLAERKEINSIRLTSAAIFDIQVYQDQAFIACGDGVLIIFDLTHWAVKRHIKVSEKSIRSITVHPQTNELALAGSDCVIQLFDMTTWALKKTIQAHQNSIFSLQYSPDYRTLMSVGRDAHLKVWDTGKGYELKADIAAHLYAINHLAYSPGKRFFATASMDKSLKVWDAASLQLLKVIDRSRHAGHGTSINKLLWTDYQGQLISASDDRSIAVWDIKFAKE